MKKTISIILVVVMAIGFIVAFSGCTEAEKVSQNISTQADNFNVMRRLTVLNMRTDKPIFEMVGLFSIDNSNYNELAVTVETGDGQYKKHFIYLNDWTMYVVEDVSGANVSKYHYEINFLPEMIVPFEFTSND